MPGDWKKKEMSFIARDLMIPMIGLCNLSQNYGRLGMESCFPSIVTGKGGREGSSAHVII